MKRISRLLFVCFILFLSCSVTPTPVKDINSVRMCYPMSVGFDEDISAKTIIATRSAVKYWNKVLGCNVFFLDEEEGEITVRDVDSFPTTRVHLPFGLGEVDIKPYEHAVALILKSFNRTTQCMSQGIVLTQRARVNTYSQNKLESVLRHELGHALGLNDIPKEKKIKLMSPLHPKEEYHPVNAEDSDIITLRKIHCGE